MSWGADQFGIPAFIARRTRSGVIGICKTRAPMARATALATAPATGTMGTSPTPRTPYGTFGTGVSMMTQSIGGTSSAVGMR